jgi:N,N'-diacetyllegionaminate synthase
MKHFLLFFGIFIKMKTEILINNKKLSEKSPIYFIAEIGSNHDCDLEQAKLLIDKCVELGADAVKFQSFSAEGLVVKNHPAFDLLEKLSLTYSWHKELSDYCNSKNIHFLSTPFDDEKVKWLEEIKTPAYKIASGDMTHYPLLKQVARQGKPILLATGIATIEEVKEAVNVIENTGNKQIVIMHCISNYPPRDEDINLQAITTLQKTFPNYHVGFSDHSSDFTASLAAIALGVKVIEKHITLSRKLKGPDHPYAMEIDEFSSLIKETRRLEKMLGSGEKKPCDAELPEKEGARRGIYASADIAANTIFKEEHFTYLRPVDGVPAKEYRSLIGKKTNIDIASDAPIKAEMIDG